MKRITIVLFSVLMLLFISGCNNQDVPTIDNVSFDTTQLESSYEIIDFNIEDYFLTVTFSDGATQQVTITESMISSSDLAKLSVSGDQTIEVLYEGYKVSITISLSDTADELSILLMSIYTTGVSEGTIIDMTYDEWLETIRGEQGLPGEDGTDGKEVLFQVSDGYIQWQYTGDTIWTNLVSLSTLTGADGSNGTNGVDGKEVLFQVSDGYIQWQYTGDTTWTNLVSLSTLTGADGSNGTDGVDGKEVLFQVADGYIQWQYVGGETWTNLIELTTLTGPAGQNGLTPYIGQNGNWWVGESDTGVPVQDDYTLDEYNSDIQSVVNEVIESVVTILVYDELDNIISLGSGVIYEFDNMGYYRVITNKHVINDASSVQILTHNNTYYDARIYIEHESKDLAILRFETTDIYRYQMPKPVEIEKYQTVIAIGTPLDVIFNNTVSTGLISKTKQTINEVDYIVHGAYLYHGNSGGPLFNTKGQLIGINTAVMTSGSNYISSLNLSIDINSILDWLEPFYLITLVNNHEVHHGPISTAQIAEYSVVWKSSIPFNRFVLTSNQLNDLAAVIFDYPIVEAELQASQIYLSIDGIQPNFDKSPYNYTLIDSDISFSIEWTYVSTFNYIFIFDQDNNQISTQGFGGKIYNPTSLTEAYYVGNLDNRRPQDLTSDGTTTGPDGSYYSWDIEGNDPVVFPLIMPNEHLTWYLIIPTENVTFIIDGFEYIIGNNFAIINKYYGQDSILTIPNEVLINGVLYPVERIEERAFKDNVYIEKLVIPNTIESIGNEAFINLVNLLSVSFDENSKLTSIGSLAFSNTDKVKKYFVPESVSTMGYDIFGSTHENGKKVIYTRLSNRQTGWDENWNSNTSVVWDFNQTIEIDGVEYALTNNGKAYVVNGENLTVENLILSIPGYEIIEILSNAFYGNQTIKSIFIPNTVIKIMEHAFMFSVIENITFEANSQLTLIETKAFLGTSQLKSIHIPNSVLYIGISAFTGNYNMESFIIEPESQLLVLSLPSTGPDDIFIPKTVTLIHETFSGKHYTVDEQNMFYSSSNGILFNKQKTVIYSFPHLAGTSQYTVSQSVQTILYRAFAFNVDLISVVLHKGIKRIENGAFEYSQVQTIYVEVSSKPDEWEERWNERYFDADIDVIWGYKIN